MIKFGDNVLSNLDDFDRAILRIIQSDNSHTHQEIGELVSLSGSAVRRRIARMKSAGVIQKEVALLDPDVTGVTVVTFITFGEETPEAYHDFTTQARQLPEVMQCYHIAGDSDFMLVSHVPSLQYYESWAMREFMSNPAIRRYDTTIVYSCKKFETAIPV